MATLRDRRDQLSRQTVWNGIDFVEIADTAQTELRVHFLNVQPEVAGHVTAARIVGGETIPSVRVLPLNAADFGHDAAGRPLLTLRVAAPGDFSIYRLELVSDRLDPYFATAAFSFKARCESTLDCATPAPVCPDEPEAAPPIDYLAKDFLSFRQALLDFSAQRFPGWRERSEADFGVMFVEALSSVADDLSYLQDRVAAEAFLETASERASLVQLARLVDYEPRPGTAARALLRVQVAASPSRQNLLSGQLVLAPTPEGGVVEFETGTGLADVGSYVVAPAWNRLTPYWFDDSERCVPCGTTSVHVVGHGLGLTPGQQLLVETEGEAGEAPLRQVVTLTSAVETTDALFGADVTHLVWQADDALVHGRDLAQTMLAGNLLPITQGRRQSETFAIVRRLAGDRGTTLAVQRTGANGTPQYLHTLARAPLAWLAGARDLAGDETVARPEIHLEQIDVSPARVWQFRRRLLDADAFEAAFTVLPMRYRALEGAAYEGVSEYDGGGGDTIGFGDGIFGEIPDEGALFRVTYRTGGGAAGNVAADAVAVLPPGSPLAAQVSALANPLAAAGGGDPESEEQVRELAPQAFQARRLRAVLPTDYQEAAERLPWVQRAGTGFRYTGSWLSVFTAVDPRGSEVLPASRQAEAVEQLDRYRLAGYESYVLAPRYASLDLRIIVCALPDAFVGDVQAALARCLDARAHLDGSLGFFHPDRFSFGMPLEKSALAAAIQEIPGVEGVLAIEYRRRGRTIGYLPMPDAVLVGRDEIVRVDNDPSRPERGSLHLDVKGGK